MVCVSTFLNSCAAANEHSTRTVHAAQIVTILKILFAFVVLLVHGFAKYAISFLFPCPSCKPSNDSAWPVRPSYLYNFLSRVTCEQNSHVASDFFRDGCCVHPTFYSRNVPPFVTFGPPAAKSWRRVENMAWSTRILPRFVQ